MPRGGALGVTMQLPTEDKVTYDKKYLENQIAILMGGRLAEEIILDQQTTGAGNDMERATSIARRMVCNWGMSEKLGPLTYDNASNGQPFGHGGRSQSNNTVSEKLAEEIDAEVRAIVERNYIKAKNILEENKDKLHKLADALLEYETLDRDQIDDLFAGKPVIVKQEAVRKRKKDQKTEEVKKDDKKETSSEDK
jgi:cell division protease FtsH